MSSYDSQDFMQVIMDASSSSDLSFEQARDWMKEQMDLRSTFLNWQRMDKQKTKERIIDDVIEHIILDVIYGDCSAIAELLRYTPTDNLIAFLPETEHPLGYQGKYITND